MKSKRIYGLGMFFLLLMAFSFTACKKYLTENPVTSFSTDDVFSNVNNATSAVMGVYARMAGETGYGIRLSLYYTVDADDMLGPPNAATPDGDRRDIARYGATPSNAQLATTFEALYSGIERANICIKNIPTMPQFNGEGSQADQTAVRRLYGESLTLRALFYFELIRNWGDVPAQFIPSADMPTLVIGKTNRDTIYEQILNDLKTAEELVPWRTEVTRDERITKGAVKGLRARIALFRGGWSLRNDTEKMERRADFLAYYQIAYEECKELLERRDQHTLYTANANGFLGLFKNYLDAHTFDPVGEILFEVAMGGGNGLADSRLGYYDGPRVNNLGNSSITANPVYFYEFDSTDTRRDVTVAPYFTSLNGDKVLQKLNSVCSGKFRRDWVSNPVISPTSQLNFFGINWPVLRFSDVLLMFAEADNEINNGPSAEAISALAEVRTRAFSNDPTKVGVIPADKEGFFNAIVSERKMEFGGEGIRKQDLIRWNLLETKLTETKEKLTLILNRQAPYNKIPTSMYYKNNSSTLIYGNSLYQPAPSQTPTGYTKVSWTGVLTAAYVTNVAQLFRPNHGELLPIPITSTQANPMLKQNPGY